MTTAFVTEPQGKTPSWQLPSPNHFHENYGRDFLSLETIANLGPGLLFMDISGA